MVGYVKIYKGDLKVREYETYNGYYCGICKSIGKRYGQLPRMALSYDAAFLAVMIGASGDEPDLPQPEHCAVHPVGKKKIIVRNSAVDFAGDMMLILAWYKLLDDIHDEGKLYARTTVAFLRRVYKKLKAKYPELCDYMHEQLAQLSKLEHDKCDNLDMAAETFAKMMEAIFREGAAALYGRGYDADTLASIGYHLGKWIYLIDAVDDIEENLKSGVYNPLLYRFQYSAENETPDQFRKRIDPDLRFNLYHYLAEISNCLDSIDIKKNKGIIENVIYFGLNRKTEEILTRVDPDKQI